MLCTSACFLLGSTLGISSRTTRNTFMFLYSPILVRNDCKSEVGSHFLGQLRSLIFTESRSKEWGGSTLVGQMRGKRGLEVFERFEG